MNGRTYGVTVAKQPHADDATYDPYAPVETSPRFANGYALIALVLGVVSIVGLLAPFTGPLGMIVGLISHVKGSRWGMPATVFAGSAMIVGMAITMYLR